MQISIFGVQLFFEDYAFLMKQIDSGIVSDKQITITYANKYVLNFAFTDKELFSNLAQFSIVYPDGIGAAWAGKLLGSDRPIHKRVVATDVLEKLNPYLLANSIPVFFFGDTADTLNRIKQFSPSINAVGTESGFGFSTAAVIEKINTSGAKILIVGLGTPLQERWITENKIKLHVPVIIAVGEGIRVFAGNKVRGSKTIQAFGFEWLVRLLADPVRLWRRYLLGIPLFIFRVIRQKISF